MSSAESLIRVHVNGKPHAVRAAATLAALVEAVTPAPHNVATAVNGAFVPRIQRAATSLRDGDHITCFQLIAGG